MASERRRVELELGYALFTGGYEAWMAKTRLKEHRVFPPLPDESRLKSRYQDEESTLTSETAA